MEPPMRFHAMPPKGGVTSSLGSPDPSWVPERRLSSPLQHPRGCGPETACLRVVFPSRHLQNLSAVIDAGLSADAKQVMRLVLLFSQQTN